MENSYIDCKMFKKSKVVVNVANIGPIFIKTDISCFETILQVFVRFVPSFFFNKCLLNFSCQLLLLKLKGTR